jgi:hypothetical protein
MFLPSKMSHSGNSHKFSGPVFNYETLNDFDSLFINKIGMGAISKHKSKSKISTPSITKPFYPQAGNNRQMLPNSLYTGSEHPDFWFHNEQIGSKVPPSENGTYRELSHCFQEFINLGRNLGADDGFHKKLRDQFTTYGRTVNESFFGDIADPTDNQNPEQKNKTTTKKTSGVESKNPCCPNLTYHMTSNKTRNEILSFKRFLKRTFTSYTHKVPTSNSTEVKIMEFVFP